MTKFPKTPRLPKLPTGPKFASDKIPSPAAHQRKQTKTPTQRGESGDDRGDHIRHPNKTGRKKGIRKPEPAGGHFVTTGGKPVFIPDSADT